MQTVYFGTDDMTRGLAIGATADLPAHCSLLQIEFPGFTLLHSMRHSRAHGCVWYLHRLLHRVAVDRSGPERWFRLDHSELHSTLEHWREREQRLAHDRQKVDELKRTAHRSHLLHPTAADKKQVDRLHALRLEIDALRFEQECLELQLKLRMSDAAGLQGLCRWDLRERALLDADRLRADHPDLALRYTVRSGTRYFRLLPREAVPA